MSWFVRNLRDMKWWKRGTGGFIAEFVGDDEQVGVNLFVLEPGDRMSMYHWEADQEGFLVLSGEALLVVENEEHPLRRWDYFHKPAGVSHAIVGAGDGPAAILALGSRDHQHGPGWGAYPYSDVAMKHDASSPEETSDPDVAYARFPSRVDAEFSEDWFR
ncbi:MAG TPA: cupin domain-containing protein [Gaiellaceae bacterium]|nr:cupin domain-containing protein [Gaiellaceae bacterium]